MRNRIIARIRSDRLFSLVVRLANHRLGRMVDIRLYADPSFRPGFAATAIGLAIRPELLRSVIEALEQAEAAAIKEGLIYSGDQSERSRS